MLKKHTWPLAALMLWWIGTLLPAGAQGLNITSETIIRAMERDTAGGNHQTVLPIYEFFSVDLADDDEEKADGFSLHLYGWGRTDMAAGDYYEDDPDGELIYGYINYSMDSDALQSRLGRQHIWSGVANESIDGFSFTYGLGKYLSLMLFGGLPAEFGEQNGMAGDVTYGGRMAALFWPAYELGVSFQQLQDDKRLLEKKAGIDFNLQSGDWGIFSGLSSFNLTNDTWREHRYDLSLFLSDFQLEPSYQYFFYQDYFDQSDSRMNLFHFLQDSDETLSIYGTDLLYSSFPEFQMGVRGRQYDYKLRDENAKYLSWLMVLKSIGGSQFGAEIGHMDGETADNLYDLFRCYLHWQDPLQIHLLEFISADALLVNYDEPIYDKERSVQFSLGAGRKFWGEFMETRFSVIYSNDPYFEDDFSGVGTLQINY